MAYSDKERLDVAKMEYRFYKKGDPVKINNNSKTIGYVSEVINNQKPANKPISLRTVTLKLKNQKMLKT